MLITHYLKTYPIGIRGGEWHRLLKHLHEDESNSMQSRWNKTAVFKFFFLVCFGRHWEGHTHIYCLLAYSLYANNSSARPGQVASGKPGAQSRSLLWVAGTQVLALSLLLPRFVWARSLMRGLTSRSNICPNRPHFYFRTSENSSVRLWFICIFSQIFGESYCGIYLTELKMSRSIVRSTRSAEELGLRLQNTEGPWGHWGSHL